MQTMNALLIAIRATLERGMTMTELAKRAGCSRQYIYKVIKGEDEPSVSKAEGIARACGYEIHLKPKNGKSL